MATVSTLANGIKVATQKTAVPAARVGIFSGMGSGAEAVQHVGKMNLFANAISAAGTGANASTSRANTQIRAQGADAKVAMAKITAALAASPNMEAARAASDAQAVAMDKDMWALSKEYAYKTAFQSESLGQPTTGSSAIINNTTAEEVADKKNSLLRAGMAVVAVGNVNHDEICAEVEKQFGSLVQSYSNIHGDHQSQLFTGSTFSHRFDSLGFAVATLIQHAVPAGHPDYWALRVANEIIGSWSNDDLYSEHSPMNLARRFTRRPELCAKFQSFYDTFPGNGVFGVTYQVNGDGDEGIEATTRLQNFWATRAKRTTDFEVVAAKNRLLLGSAMDAQNDPVGFIGEQVLSSGSVSNVQSLRSQMNVDANTVCKAFDYWLYDQEIAAGMVGCVDGLPQTYQLRAGTAHQQPW